MAFDLSAFVRSVIHVLERDTADGKRLASCDLIFAVRKRNRIPDRILEWRLRAVLSTLALLGAFPGFECRRGRGWSRVPPRRVLVSRAAA